jgi:hypothetical protein
MLFRIQLLYDTDSNAARVFGEKNSVPAFDDVKEMIGKTRPFVF